jgi:hypothetical protein
MKIYRALMVRVTIALVLAPMVGSAQVEQGWGEGGAMDRGRMGRQGPGRGSMGSDSKAMRSMLGIMPEIGGMLEQIARRIEAGQLTPDQMTRVGKWLGKLSALLNATPEMLRRGPTESGAPGGSSAGPEAIQQRLADLQWLLSDMLTTPQ